MGGRRKKTEGNAALGEKNLKASESSSSSSSDDDGNHNLLTSTGTAAAGKDQGRTGATEVVEKEGKEVAKPLSDKDRKKVEAKEAKAKRDQVVK
jgi:hypothetical protein